MDQFSDDEETWLVRIQPFLEEASRSSFEPIKRKKKLGYQVRDSPG